MKKLHPLFVGIIFITLFEGFGALAACSKAKVSSSNHESDTTNLKPYKLIWQDNFDEAILDTSKWNYEVNGAGGGNNELQYYTNLAENCFVKDGYLVIQALKKDYNGKAYTSARINTDKKGDWLYGKFEIRAKLPSGQGLWPAIWMLPSDWVYGGWPLSGEIDIMEELGQTPNKVYGTIHYGNPHQHQGSSYVLEGSDFSKDFHLFSIEWTYNSISFFVDHNKYYTAYISRPFDQRFHFILNVAVGGNWPGSPDTSTQFPQQMVIDFVRVYQRK